MSDKTNARDAGIRQQGVVRAIVTDTFDLTMQGRVKLRLPSISNIELWAPVCAPFAGAGDGLYCMPKVDGVVIVAFENGDAAWPVVLGSVWNTSNRPPADQQSDAMNKLVRKTPSGHRLMFDDSELSITLTHPSGHTVSLTAGEISIELAEGGGRLTLALPGTSS